MRCGALQWEFCGAVGLHIWYRDIFFFPVENCFSFRGLICRLSVCCRLAFARSPHRTIGNVETNGRIFWYILKSERPRENSKLCTACTTVTLRCTRAAHSHFARSLNIIGIRFVLRSRLNTVVFPFIVTEGYSRSNYLKCGKEKKKNKKTVKNEPLRSQNLSKIQHWLRLQKFAHVEI